ncbi:MAG: hypothetical protein HY042_04055 [Spirochaetia bacterium]|nr:hypothetical protein [Spirochaetia bacterium]
MDTKKTIALPGARFGTALLFLAAWGLFAWITFIKDYTPDQIHYCADQSELFETSGRILSGVLIDYGPPSRAGTENLGPLFYYFLAALEKATGGDLFILHLVLCLLQSSAFLFFALIIHQRTGSRVLALAGAVAAYSYVTYFLLRLAWGPAINVFLFVFSLFLAHQILVNNRTRRISLLFVLLAFQIQTHPSMVLPCLGIGLVTWYRLRSSTGASSRDWQTVSFHSRLALVSFGAPFLFTLHRTATVKGANLQKLIALHASPNGQTGVEAAATFLWDFLVQPAHNHHAAVYGIFVIGVCVVGGAAHLMNSRASSRREAGGIISIPFLMSLVSLLFIHEKIQDYYLAYATFYPFLFFTDGVSVIAGAARYLRVPVLLGATAGLLYFSHPGLLSNYRTYTSSDWNKCPYGEMTELTKKLKESSRGAPVNVRTTGEAAPASTTSFIRLFAAAGIQYAKTGPEYIITTSPGDPVPPAKGGSTMLFQGRQFTLSVNP